jgi:hypothetical protein
VTRIFATAVIFVLAGFGVNLFAYGNAKWICGKCGKTSSVVASTTCPSRGKHS